MRFSHLLAAMLVIALTSVWALWATNGSTPYFGDEGYWTTAGDMTMTLLERHAPPDAWGTDLAPLGPWGAMNPPLGKLYFGAILRLVGIRNMPIYRWDYNYSLEDNRAQGHVPPMALITPVRLSVVGLAGVCLWLTYLCAWHVLQHPSAVLAPLACFTEMIYTTTHVSPDIPVLALVLLSGYLLLRYVDEPTTGRVIASAIVAGLACSVKFNAAQAVIALALVTLWAPTKKHRLEHTILALAVPCAVFLATNPFLWTNPVGRLIGLFAAWHEVKTAQQHMAFYADVTVLSRGRALALVLQHAVLPDAFRLPAVIRWLTLTAVIGCGLLSLKQRANRRVLAWSCLAGSSFALTVLWLPLDWENYYLLPLVWLAPLTSAAVLYRPQASIGSRETKAA